MSDYIIYTKDNGVLNFTNDLRIFMGRYDVNINYWNKIYTNVKDYYATTIIGSTQIPANEKINIADISIDEQYIIRNITMLTTLSFTTSDYNNITDNDTITFTIEFNTPDIQQIYTITYPLHKMFIQTIQLFKTIRITTLLNKISIYLTSTFPLNLRYPSTKTAKYAKQYCYIVGI